MCPIFDGSDHNFCRSNDDMIEWKIAYFQYMDIVLYMSSSFGLLGVSHVTFLKKKELLTKLNKFIK